MAAPIILCDTAGMTNEQWLDERDIIGLSRKAP